MRRVLPFLVAGAAVLPFLPALSGGFLQWDDAANLIDNAAWRGLSASHLRWMLTTTHMGPWQPLSWLTYAVDFAVWGLDPFHFHLTNLFLHAATTGLLVMLLDALLAAGAPATPPRRRILAAAGGALLWAVHPLRVESVCWITERREVLSAAFYVLSLLLYVRKPGRILGAWLAFVAACLAKGSALTLPLTLLVLDRYPLRRGWSRAVLKEKIPFFIVSLTVGAVGFLGQAADASLKDLSAAGPGLRAALALRGLSFYAEKTLWPAGLSPFYGVPRDFGLLSAATLASSLAVLAAAGVAWRLRRRAPALGAALAHHAVALAPLLGLVRFGEHLAADRYAHLSGLGWAALASAALLRAPAAALPLALVFSCLSWPQSKAWRSDLELWTAAEAATPYSRHALVNLAGALRAAGREDEAAAREAVLLERFPDVIEPRVNYGGWLAARGRHAEALAALRVAPTTGRHAAKARYNRALALEGLGRRREAVAELRAALALEENYAEARNNLGLALMKEGRFGEARQELGRAIRLKPGWSAPLFNRGLLLAKQGSLKDALADFDAAAALTPGGGPAAVNAAAVRRALSGR